MPDWTSSRRVPSCGKRRAANFPPRSGAEQRRPSGTSAIAEIDDLTPELGLFFWTLVAFLNCILILKKFAWKPNIETHWANAKKVLPTALLLAEKVKKEMSQFTG